MALTAIDPTIIYTGNTYTLSVSIAPNNTPLTDPATDVRAAIISPYRDANLSGTITLSYIPATQEWHGTFSKEQTRQLLNDPSDLTSGLLYNKPLIEVEVIAIGYTRHYQATASASLIIDGPIDPPPPGQTYITSEEFLEHTQLVGVEGHIPATGLLQADVVGLVDELQEVRDLIVSSGIREFSFVDSDLSVVGVLPIVHNLGEYPRSPTVWSESNEEIKPDDIDYVSENAIAIYVKSYRPIIGTWRVTL